MTQVLKEEGIKEIPIQSIRGIFRELRTQTKVLDKDFLESIKEKGVLIPIVVRPVPEGYQVVAGSRRYRATKEVGRKTIRAVIIDLEDEPAYEIALVENIQRNSMDPVEEAEAFQDYVTKYDKSAAYLARKLGKDPSYVTRRITLAKAPEPFKLMVSLNDLAPSRAEELISKIKDENALVKEAEKIVEQRKNIEKNHAIGTISRSDAQIHADEVRKGRSGDKRNSYEVTCDIIRFAFQAIKKTPLMQKSKLGGDQFEVRLGELRGNHLIEANDSGSMIATERGRIFFESFYLANNLLSGAWSDDDIQAQCKKIGEFVK